ncbi:hypothetical protein BU23DRAFT_71454 [Bimuria novae-zelandiae CBS 107.79]|uniref:Uncharacterized protein n=1 Tax=Bimuria novae-zelandiae CBS 107.79 TaxID=1447943 RepID=A0A6A5UIK4_9PLEO|nr:hypothetical protein BU23DRAFT_71454 [Bimuria novae-zelandiae CBS 107.79]
MDRAEYVLRLHLEFLGRIPLERESTIVPWVYGYDGKYRIYQAILLDIWADKSSKHTFAMQLQHCQDLLQLLHGVLGSCCRVCRNSQLSYASLRASRVRKARAKRFWWKATSSPRLICCPGVVCIHLALGIILESVQAISSTVSEDVPSPNSQSQCTADILRVVGVSRGLQLRSRLRLNLTVSLDLLLIHLYQ